MVSATPLASLCPRACSARGARARGVTLLEILITLSVVVVVTVGVGFGLGAASTARLRRSAALVASAVKAAYTHAAQTGKPTRVVFELAAGTITVEEADRPMLLQAGDKSGGAEPATEAEREAAEEAKSVLTGPRAPRASFKPVKPRAFQLMGADARSDGEAPTRSVEAGVRFVSIDTRRQEAAETEGRGYVYCFPGGSTEAAAIVLTLAASAGVPDETNSVTVIVSPLTGKSDIRRGVLPLPKPRSEAELSERDERGL